MERHISSKLRLFVSTIPIVAGRLADAAIQIQNIIIEPQENMKILGVIISSNRTWTKHINYLIKSVQPKMIAIRQLAKLGSRKTIAMLGQALVISKLTYAIQAWGGTTMANRQRLQVVINQLARMAIGPTAQRMSTPKMMKELKWMSIDQLIHARTLAMATAISSTSQPEEIAKKLNKFCLRRTRNRNEETRIPPSWKQEKSKMSFSVRAVENLNSCPDIIKAENTKHKRKRLIKTHITQTYSYYVLPKLGGGRGGAG